MGLVELWWIADLAIIVGMLAAYNADAVANFLETTVFKIIQNSVSRNTNLSQDTKRIGAKNKKKHTYNVISVVLTIGFCYNLLVNALAKYEQGRSSLVNLAYFFYPLATVYVSLHDILLNDDRSEWSLKEKQRHIIWPFNFVDKKILGKPIYGDQKITQLITAKNKMSDSTVFGLLATTLLLARVMPNGAFFLWCFFPLYFHEKLNSHLNAVMDYLTISEMKNKFDHFFGTYSGIFKKAECHDQLGMQYEMFKRSCKPAENVLKKQVFNKVRKAKYPVKTALCATMVARGVAVTALLYVLGLQNPKYFGGSSYNPSKNNVISTLLLGSAPTMLYYIMQCIMPTMGFETTLSKSPFFRMFVWFPAECLASGYLLYKPVLNHVKRAPSAVFFPAVMCLTALEVYNKSGILQEHMYKMRKQLT